MSQLKCSDPSALSGHSIFVSLQDHADLDTLMKTPMTIRDRSLFRLAGHPLADPLR